LSRRCLSLRVHSVFGSTLNLEVLGSGQLISLTGPSGTSYPHAVALERGVDFQNWPLAAGLPGRYAHGIIRLQGMKGPLVINLRGARRPPAWPLPVIPRLGGAYWACVGALVAIQEAAGYDLRLSALRGQAHPGGGLGAGLTGAARAMAAPARACKDGAGPDAGLHRAVAGLVGLGAGLTPAGDDFLSGFLAAARCAGPGPAEALVSALGEALGRNLWRTGSLSATLLAWSIRNQWPVPLGRLAMALAADATAEARTALDDVCRIGHSSGADLATGFLYGLSVLLAD
jgi:hypothetical protein